MLARASGASEIMVTGWVDQALEPQLKRLLQNGVAIINPTGAAKRPSREAKDAVNRLRRYGVQLGQNGWTTREKSFTQVKDQANLTRLRELARLKIATLPID